MWSKTTALGMATSSGMVSPLTILFLAVGAGGEKIIAWLGWGQAASWLGAVSRLLGGHRCRRDSCGGEKPPWEHCSPLGGKGLGHAWMRGHVAGIRLREGQSHRNISL